jgi:hypothetical protein
MTPASRHADLLWMRVTAAQPEVLFPAPSCYSDPDAGAQAHAGRREAKIAMDR